MRYFLSRLLLIPPLMLLISLVAFGLLHLVPSDPAEVALRLNDIELTPEIIAQTRQELGLDQPFWQRYWLWLGNALQGDFGRSFINNQPILDEMLNALPTTLLLAGSALTLIVVVSVILAILAMFKPNHALDNSVRAVLFLFTAMPNYWLALLLIWGLAVKLNLFPVGGLEQPQGIILPSLTLALGYIGTYFRLLRGAMLNQLQQPYIFYARARGLSDKRLIFRHVLPNSLHNALTGIGMSIPKLLAGSVVVENLFALNGVGRLCIQAIFGRDYPMIQAYVLLMSALFLGFNLLIDVVQHWLDPRLRK